MCPELEYVVWGWRSVIAVLLKVSYLYMHIQNTTYTEIMHLLQFLPNDCGPAKSNTTRQNTCSSALMMYAFEVYKKEITRCSFLK